MLGGFVKSLFGSPKNIEKRKSYRLVVPPGIEASLHVSFGIGQQIPLNILNLNETAIAAEYDADQYELTIGEEETYRLSLNIHGESFQCRGEPLRYADGFVVFRYPDLSEADHQRLVRLFPILLGQSLKKQSLEVADTDWYHGNNDTDLFLKRDSDRKKIISLTFVSENNYLYWNSREGARTGEVIRATYAEGFEFAKREANAIELHASPQKAMIDRFKVILQNSPMSSGDMEELKVILEGAP